MKVYGCKLEKSWLPYEWFDTPDKLDYPGLSQWKAYKRLFREKGIRTFANWLRNYNNLDVVPGLEALENMRAFYIEKKINVLKDAVSISGVSLQYLMQGSINRGAELWSPCKKEYHMLKGAVVGGPSLVFTRYHEAGVRGIRSHQFTNSKPCRRILAFDANVLYLSTMAKDLPCRKGEVVTHAEPVAAAALFTQRVKSG